MKDAAVLPGVDGEKMSKSYGNDIDPFQEEKALRKRVMSIKTDSLGVDDVKDPETSVVFRIFRAIAGPLDPRTTALADRFRSPGMGYGHAKQALFDLPDRAFRFGPRSTERADAPPRRHRGHLEKERPLRPREGCGDGGQGPHGRWALRKLKSRATR